jgi:hypothetical protein
MRTKYKSNKRTHQYYQELYKINSKQGATKQQKVLAKTQTPFEDKIL